MLELGLLQDLWVRMVDRFGVRWISSYGASPDPCGAWAEDLAGLTAEDIDRGMAAVVAAGMDWPPSSPQFRALCMPPAPAAPPRRRSWWDLPRPPRSPEEREHARACIADLKRLAAGGGR